MLNTLNTLIGITAALTNGLEPMDSYGSNNYRRTLPPGIDLHAEYQRIQNKQSSLSKWERDEVVRLYEKHYL
jgi:hypothetical protein